MDMDIPADLSHGLLMSMRQLCKACPSVWDQGIHLYLPTKHVGRKRGLSAVVVGLLGSNMGWHRFHGHGDPC